MPPGPPPKRSTARRRRNPPAMPVLQTESAAELVWPAADPGWHPLMRGWYGSLADPAADQYRLPSDVAEAQVWAEVGSRLLFATRLSAQGLAVWQQGAARLASTEVDRRRVRIEVQRRPSPAVDVDSVLRRWGVIRGGANAS